ncbi:uncharacterized protein LAJ45_04832 [Morchella importuna]|uniref:uncharacterized protein n=1 Tax=Morchella importuna TaxID=1174673 RepID=UPI001E8DAF37|nr:uncharacterized protein LAJ45_04832 [Morchella importuna]KAH8151130.1 hypothetical protein LAJ45_04832 [Morchella importuna]
MPVLPYVQNLVPREVSFTTQTNVSVDSNPTTTSTSCNPPTAAVILFFGIAMTILGIIIAILNLWVNVQSLLLCRRQHSEAIALEPPSRPEQSAAELINGVPLSASTASFSSTTSTTAASVETTDMAVLATVAAVDRADSTDPEEVHDPQ